MVHVFKLRKQNALKLLVYMKTYVIVFDVRVCGATDRLSKHNNIIATFQQSTYGAQKK